jgi:sigma-B regulation protein RsbU (phosphoserine phosphatase)
MARDVDAQVLVVDDRDYLRQILVAVLEDFGYPAAGFASASAALEQLPALRPQLILLDLQMPGMDGCEFLRRLRANPAWNDLPVLIVSGVGEAVPPAGDRRALAVLPKPFDNDTLIARVRQMIGPAPTHPAGALRAPTARATPS